MDFEWDEGNSNKNLKSHTVANSEAEEAFFDSDKVQYPDLGHSQSEQRFILIGKTQKARLLFVVYTTRKNKVRVISARDLNKKEIFLYEKNT